MGLLSSVRRYVSRNKNENFCSYFINTISSFLECGNFERFNNPRLYWFHDLRLLSLLYKKGQEDERAKWLAEKGVEFEAENSEEIERLKQLSKDMWVELKNGIPIDEDLRHIANDLRRSTSISVLDTSAFTFAEMGDRKTALEIYQYRIFPMLQEQDEASISKYERHYAILQNCVPRSCMKELYNIN